MATNNEEPKHNSTWNQIFAYFENVFLLRGGKIISESTVTIEFNKPQILLQQMRISKVSVNHTRGKNKWQPKSLLKLLWADKPKRKKGINSDRDLKKWMGQIHSLIYYEILSCFFLNNILISSPKYQSTQILRYWCKCHSVFSCKYRAGW